MAETQTSGARSRYPPPGRQLLCPFRETLAARLGSGPGPAPRAHGPLTDATRMHCHQEAHMPAALRGAPQSPRDTQRETQCRTHGGPSLKHPRPGCQQAWDLHQSEITGIEFTSFLLIDARQVVLRSIEACLRKWDGFTKQLSWSDESSTSLGPGTRFGFRCVLDRSRNGRGSPLRLASFISDNRCKAMADFFFFIFFFFSFSLFF